MKRSIVLSFVLLFLLGTTFYVSDQDALSLSKSEVRAQRPPILIDNPIFTPVGGNNGGSTVWCSTILLDWYYSTTANPIPCNDGSTSEYVELHYLYSCNAGNKGTCLNGWRITYSGGCNSRDREEDSRVLVFCDNAG